MNYSIPNSLTQKFTQFSGSKLFWWLMLFGVCIQVLPMVILGGDSVFHTYYNYGEIALTKAIISHGDGFHLGATMDYVMNGLPRGIVKSPFNFTFLLFTVFNSPSAYIINYFLSHLVAFLGMYLLLKNYLLKSSDQPWIAPVIALLFASVSWVSIYGWFIAAQPLLYYSFFNLAHNKQKWTDWLVIVLFPFTSTIIMIGPFIMCALTTGLVVFWYIQKKFPIQYFLGLILLFILFIFFEFQTLYELFFTHSFISHRTSWPLPEAVSIYYGFRVAIGEMFFTHHFGGMFLTRVILVSFVIYLSIAISEQKISRKLLFFPVFIFLVCLLHGYYTTILHYLNLNWDIIKIIQFDKFYLLLQCLWLIWFALLIDELYKIFSLRILALFLVFFQLASIVQRNDEFTENSKKLAGKSKGISFNEYFAVSQFENIKNYIHSEPSTYRVISLGLSPIIPLYNGFYVLDGYFTSYPLAHKQKMGKVMEKELNRLDNLKLAFNESGNQCFLLSGDLDGSFVNRKEIPKKINSLEFDTNELKGLGCKYMISAVEYIEPEKGGFALEKKFIDANSAWDIYLYRLL